MIFIFVYTHVYITSIKNIIIKKDKGTKESH